MIKSKFFKNTFILIIGSILTRLLGFLIRIIFVRTIGQDGINLYSLIMPTYSLLISLAGIGLPLAVSTITARNKTPFKKIFISVIPIVLLINLILIILVIYLAPFISINLLKTKEAIMPIKVIGIILPFISISSILRGYYFGKERMEVYTKSSIIEQIIRLLIVIIIMPKVTKYGYINSLSIFLALSVLSELSSIIVFLKSAPNHNFRINKNIYDSDITKEVMGLCLPSTAGRIISNILYFIEPIIIMNSLLDVGYSKKFILNEYGIYNAYALPLLMIPSFIVMAISTSLIPEISKSYARKEYKLIKRKVYLALKLCIILGLLTNTFVFIFPNILLKLIYNTSEGINYIRVLAPIFVLYNLEGPLSSALSAINKPKEALRATSIGAIIKTIIVLLLSRLRIGLYSLIIGEIISILVTVKLSLKYFKRAMK